MNNDIKLRYELERAIFEIKEYLEKFVVGLRELVPKAFEEKEKEIILRNGDIYLHSTNSYYYLLQQHEGNWKLINVRSPCCYWCGWLTPHEIIDELNRYFTLCPNAKIIVLDISKEEK